ncbi:hypothetical protein SCACP_05930 [Sporomusa carbonis]
MEETVITAYYDENGKTLQEILNELIKTIVKTAE